MQHTCISEAKVNGEWEAKERRQSLTTWGILALAVFVSVGMAEWSKRMAASETVIDPAVMEEALKIAAAAASSVNVKVNVNENLSGGSRVAGPDRVGAGDALPATSNPKPATAGSESAGLQK